MPRELMLYGIGLLVLVTVYWAAVWYWLPSWWDKRERRQPKPPPSDPASRNRGSR